MNSTVTESEVEKIYIVGYGISFFLHVLSIAIHATGIAIILNIGRKSNQRYLLLNLSLISICGSTVEIPRSLFTLAENTEHLSDRDLPHAFNLSNAFIIGLQLMYIFDVFLLTLDRLIAISKPFQYKKHCYHSRCFASIAVAWVISIITCIVVLATYQYDTPALWSRIIMIIVIIEYLFIIVAYIKIFLIIRRQDKQKIRRTTAKNRKSLKIPLSIIAVFTVFFICPSVVCSLNIHRYNAYKFNGLYVPIYMVGVVLDGLIYLILKDIRTFLMNRGRVSPLRTGTSGRQSRRGNKISSKLTSSN